MAGIYIHIPFCRQKCHYCNFYSLASDKHRNEFISTLTSEISLRKEYVGNEIIESIYLGGGTPSVLKEGHLTPVFAELYKHFNIHKHPEITLEANPDDISHSFIKGLKSTPVNRLSIGVQSFRDADLFYLNRVHSAQQAIASIKTVQDSGFLNLSVDLIYGIPTLSEQDWEDNLDAFFSMNIPHLSAYALTVEPKTVLEVLIKKGKMEGVKDTKMARQFIQLINRMNEHNYTHYEISNYCKEDGFARHNTNYWLGGNYLGLGPSAHSYNGSSRQWNIAHLKKYIAGIESGVPLIEKEILSLHQKYNEYIMVSLRTIWGVDTDLILKKFGKNYKDYFQKQVERFIAKGLVINNSSTYLLTEKGKLLADGIASELFWLDEEK